MFLVIETNSIHERTMLGVMGSIHLILKYFNLLNVGDNIMYVY